jgi:hypothetical protein
LPYSLARSSLIWTNVRPFCLYSSPSTLRRQPLIPNRKEKVILNEAAHGLGKSWV